MGSANHTISRDYRHWRRTELYKTSEPRVDATSPKDMASPQKCPDPELWPLTLKIFTVMPTRVKLVPSFIEITVLSTEISALPLLATNPGDATGSFNSSQLFRPTVAYICRLLVLAGRLGTMYVWCWLLIDWLTVIVRLRCKWPMTAWRSRLRQSAAREQFQSADQKTYSSAPRSSWPNAYRSTWWSTCIGVDCGKRSAACAPRWRTSSTATSTSRPVRSTSPTPWCFTASSNSWSKWTRPPTASPTESRQWYNNGGWSPGAQRCQWPQVFQGEKFTQAYIFRLPSKSPN